MSAVITLTHDLVAKASVTPDDQGCQALLARRLAEHGFVITHHRFGEVDNLLATHTASDASGAATPHILWIGHTDVVPPGPEADWTSPPFEPTERDGYLFGRGVADMKGAVAGMVCGLIEFVESQPQHAGRVSILITSDEEGPAIDGIRAVVPHLKAEGLWPDVCLVGEPSSQAVLGDQIRIGRRGSIQAQLAIRGRQGHTAYAQAQDNPVHRAGGLIQSLGALTFDDGDEHFASTHLQISNIHAGTGADNVSPGELMLKFNIRNNPNSPAASLKAQIESLIKSHDVGDWTLQWRVSAEPFGPCQSHWVDQVLGAMVDTLGRTPRLDTGGGTSDGRFFGPEGVPVIEIGPVNATIHQIDECLALEDLNALPHLYHQITRHLIDGGQMT